MTQPQPSEQQETVITFSEGRPDDGSDGAHYDLLIHSGRIPVVGDYTLVQCAEVIEGLGLNHALGEALCAIWRIGRKPGESRARALRKAKYYIERELEREEA